ncbi:NlpC/P60 family protein [Kribbella catacumbae]|uniref:NlpC/P60 family protein n=1 Tax=Kribbella catacumbae TaxID=460086 RepID=UPI00039A2E78|nr:NlpC/P60 family protein [Kribbella catacumbae]
MTLATGRVEKLIVRGRGLTSDVAEAVIDGQVSLTTDGATQVNFTVADSDLTLLRSRLFDRGGYCDYDNLRLVISARELVDGAGGPRVQVTARSLGWRKLKIAKGALVRRKVSPTQFAYYEAKAYGLGFVGEPSAVRSQIARQTGEQAESSWDTIQRLAKEIGFVAFESGGILYFGRPTWLLTRPGIVTYWPLVWSSDESKRTEGLQEVPNCRDSDDSGAAAETTVKLLSDDAERIRPGDLLILYGVGTFDGRYMVTGVEIPFGGAGVVTVTASTPINPTPEPPETPSVSKGKKPMGSASSSVEKFVQACLDQAGDRYAYGAEASAKDADPDAFDCSELVEWAAKRAGAFMPDGSANQLAYVRKKGKTISVATAIKTRGALLFAPGHVAVSLGNGRTIEAMNRKYGVRQGTASTSRFTAAGLVPSLRYK